MHAGLCVVRSKFGIIFRKREKKKEKKKNWGEPGKGEGILHVPQKETPASYIPFLLYLPPHFNERLADIAPLYYYAVDVVGSTPY